MPKIDEWIPVLKLKNAGLQLAVVFGALMLVAAPHTIARIGKCSVGSLTPAEESLLLGSARRSLPPRTEPTVSNLCGSTSAELTTPKIADQTGSRRWWVANCWRDSHEWVCSPVQFREIVKRLLIRGVERRVTIAFEEKNTVLESVASVATRALTLFADPASVLPYCGGTNGGESRWHMLREQHPLRSETRVDVTAQRYAQTGTVLLDEVIQPDDIKIEIQLPLVDSDMHQVGFPCWAPMAH